MAIKLPKWGHPLVRLGFVVEGDSERILVESTIFNNYLSSLNLQVCKPVINVCGGGNLKHQNIDKYVNECLNKAKPDYIFVLTDLENDLCISETKNRIKNENIHSIIVSCKT